MRWSAFVRVPFAWPRTDRKESGSEIGQVERAHVALDREPNVSDGPDEARFPLAGFDIIASVSISKGARAGNSTLGRNRK